MPQTWVVPVSFHCSRPVIGRSRNPLSVTNGCTHTGQFHFITLVWFVMFNRVCVKMSDLSGTGSSKMTYNVLMGTLNPTHSLSLVLDHRDCPGQVAMNRLLFIYTVMASCHRNNNIIINMRIAIIIHRRFVCLVY